MKKDICGMKVLGAGMSLLEVDPRFRVTLSREIRKTFKVVKGQKLYAVPFGDGLLVKPVPMNPAERLQEIIGDFTFDREARRKAEKWFLRQVGKKT